ncbi:hypothetical protein EAE91_01295 [Photorhabdus noenieputensis]|uniref:hypothetical protein n=1 Tax=Photorhabdus noenieputensis TaxID=1208607 RepID=UPI001BD66BC9|nr:hypothetical protein [Photorhabdus noenieputensis]MBS9435863.1 hypothetical protein [Photorhabdus noenieputensis]MCK3667576.1 hypothetical protein [Photorhabdus noenieputensis]
MSDKDNTNLNLVVSMEGHSVPTMQRVFVGNGASVPVMQAVPSTGQQSSSSTGQNIPQNDNSSQKNSTSS